MCEVNDAFGPYSTTVKYHGNTWINLRPAGSHTPHTCQQCLHPPHAFPKDRGVYFSSKRQYNGAHLPFKRRPDISCHYRQCTILLNEWQLIVGENVRRITNHCWGGHGAEWSQISLSLSLSSFHHSLHLSRSLRQEGSSSWQRKDFRGCLPF